MSTLSVNEVVDLNGNPLWDSSTKTVTADTLQGDNTAVPVDSILTTGTNITTSTGVATVGESLDKRVVVDTNHIHYKEAVFETDRTIPGSFPQGLFYDEEAQHMYIGYARVGATYTTYVVHSMDGTVLGQIRAGATNYPEGFAVVYRGGRKLLYTKSESDSLGKLGIYDITDHAFDNSVVSPESEHDVGMHYQMAFDGRYIYVENITSVGGYEDRLGIAKYDLDMNFVGDIQLPGTHVGNNDFRTLPKKQAFAVFGSEIFTGVGDANVNTNTPQGGYLGVVSYSPCGNVVREALYDKQGFIDKINEMYDTSATTAENEGICTGKDGSVYSLWVISPLALGSTVKVFKDFVLPSKDSYDFSGIAANALSVNLQGIWTPIRHPDSSMRHPTSGAEITTLAEMYSVMVEFSIREASFYRKNFPNLQLEDITAPNTFSKVTVSNMSNNTGFLHIEKDDHPLFRFLLQYDIDTEELVVTPQDRRGPYVADANDYEDLLVYGNYRTDKNTSNIPGTYGTLRVSRYGKDNVYQEWAPSGNAPDGDLEHYRKLNFNTKQWSPWYTRWSTANTTVDGSGFLKEASPVAKVYTDTLVANSEAEGAELTKEGVGIYRVTGTEGLAETGWYIETPKDANNNIKVFVEVADEGDDVVLKTFKPDYSKGYASAGEPMDIPSGRWVDLRFNKPPFIEEEFE